MNEKKELIKSKIMKPLRKRQIINPVGAPLSAERELTLEQKQFAYLLASGVPPEIAGQRFGWSHYLIKTNSDPEQRPLIAKEVESWKGVIALKDGNRFVVMYDDLITEIIMSMQRLARENKLNQDIMHKMLTGKMDILSGLPRGEVTSTTIMEKVTEATSRKIATPGDQTKRIRNVFDHPDFKREQEEYLEEKITKTRERSIEQINEGEEENDGKE